MSNGLILDSWEKAALLRGLRGEPVAINSFERALTVRLIERVAAVKPETICSIKGACAYRNNGACVEAPINSGNSDAACYRGDNDS